MKGCVFNQESYIPLTLWHRGVRLGPTDCHSEWCVSATGYEVEHHCRPCRRSGRPLQRVQRCWLGDRPGEWAGEGIVLLREENANSMLIWKKTWNTHLGITLSNLLCVQGLAKNLVKRQHSIYSHTEEPTSPHTPTTCCHQKPTNTHTYTYKMPAISNAFLKKLGCSWGMVRGWGFVTKGTGWV